MYCIHCGTQKKNDVDKCHICGGELFNEKIQWHRRPLVILFLYLMFFPLGIYFSFRYRGLGSFYYTMAIVYSLVCTIYLIVDYTQLGLGNFLLIGLFLFLGQTFTKRKKEAIYNNSDDKLKEYLQSLNNAKDDIQKDDLKQNKYKKRTKTKK